MIHEHLISGKFLLDLKNDHSGLLKSAGVAHHHHQQPLHHLQPPSPPLPVIQLYSAYAYQHQLQQQLFNSAIPHYPSTNQQYSLQSADVLDLSRRESVETHHKTPSPNQTNISSSTSSSDDCASPLAAQLPAAASLITSNLLYAAQTQQHPTNLNTAPNLAAIYPKQEPVSTTPSPTPMTVNNTLSQSFASVAAAAAASSLHQPQQNIPEPHSPPQQQQKHQENNVTSPTSSISSLASQDSKNTRPFKAFPRDPLVIAANFAASDILLDNPRVERYTEYRKRILEQIRSSNGGSRTITNPKMRRTNSINGCVQEGSFNNNNENEDRQLAEELSDCESISGNDALKSPDHLNHSLSSSGAVIKDAAYYERRRKNNAAAKKSRDRRRIKEDEIAIRAAYLERQNIELICQIDALKAQLAALSSKMS